MYITIDGVSGAGKTTQAQLLHERLSLEYTPFLPVVYATENIPAILGKQSQYTELFSVLLAAHTIPSDADYIVEDFWAVFRSMLHLNIRDLKNALSFFQTGITLGRRPPDLSVYLSITYDIQVSRLFERHTGITVPPVGNDNNVNQFEQLNQFWGTIAQEVNYFHVVDGTLPVEDVHASIMTLIESQ